MSVETPTRLADARSGDATETRAAELLRALQPPPARLAPSARARIAATLDERAARAQAPRRVFWPAAVAAAIVLFAGGVVGAAWGIPVRATLARPLGRSARPTATPARPVAAPAPAAAPVLAAPDPAPAPEPTSTLAPATGPRRHVAHAPRPHESRARRGSVVAESRLLAGALQDLRQRHDAQAALAALDDYERRFPAGVLAPQAAAARIDALLALGRRAGAIRGSRRSRSMICRAALGLRTLRGELRAGRGELGAALDDFTAVLTLAGARSSVVERALYGRGSCRSRPVTSPARAWI